MGGQCFQNISSKQAFGHGRPFSTQIFLGGLNSPPANEFCTHPGFSMHHDCKVESDSKPMQRVFAHSMHTAHSLQGRIGGF